MNYKINLYNKGHKQAQTNVEAKTHLEAIKIAHAKNKYIRWTHASVKGKTTKRYTADVKVIKAEPKFFKTTLGSAYAIMVMLGSIVEFHKYYHESERDKAFEEAVKCTESIPAESATADKEQTSTTVSTGETSDSKSGLTDQKISSGSVTNATWTDALTHINTDKSSGKNKSEDSAENKWLLGSKASRSRQNTKTLWAKVLRVPSNEYSPWPGTNRGMQDLKGEIIRVTKKENEAFYVGGGLGWMWLPEWLEILNTVEATVKDIKPHTIGSYGGSFVDEMTQYIGKKLSFTHSDKDDTYHATTNSWTYAPEWLDFSVENTVQKQDYAKLPETNMNFDEIGKLVREHYKFIGGKFPIAHGVIDPTATS